ncbi:Ribosomal RNA small subunit methyltransferase A [Tepidanaerobacter acetatoxydans Re1]|uniref:Ribosomal RNA small subunit methyltransferase A n=1 Tax=Tepidanaerobacter acetatoxydans (strain DSM 21804 / JCM 16047 / Re1) TaxID=1209989 RepID=F4LRM4_TEPAE|nr:16S rRNA (adenine(1518)-N(6)/adenine(1519)-N(6))-dimethyltransferase RsmA [Tepidanaerobacter acetatoxydans]AEE90287.1 Ribosomal RNA small subunit methyltransferase A [Tepidanaerobacter acetatoxydans Re1]CCP24763.1 Ribosomal RNA small subunit methyltransferase A [Tepidanaerobacter acetatoxydans Re1]
MKKYNIKADKRLGQHFLIDSRPLLSMIEAAQLSPEDEVLEIGPGLGVLTLELGTRAKRVVAVEKDRQLIPVLDDLTRDFKNICILEEDVLKLDLEKMSESLFGGRFKVIANLPYYITNPIIMKIIENRNMVTLAVLMVQKEVAQRLTACPGKKDYGILSIAVKLYADVNMICTIGRESFLPPPKVESAVVRLTLRQEPRVQLKDESFFFKVVEAAFGERRKTIKNSLKSRLALAGTDLDIIDKALEAAGIDALRRGETLSIEEYARLAEELQRHMS